VRQPLTPPTRGAPARRAVVASILAATGISLAVARPAAAQDVLAVGRVTVGAAQTAVALPVTVRDHAGTPLDEGAGADGEIQGFGFRVDFAPAALVAGVGFALAGVTAGRTPTFPVVLPAPDHRVVLMSFAEATDPLAFTLGAPAPGDVVGEIELTLAAPLAPGDALTFTLAPASATLVNDTATVSESVAAGTLALSGGAVLPRLVFADGFESGDLSAWSAGAP
jgi:hypothetical protein